jgi:hypothetical protein
MRKTLVLLWSALFLTSLSCSKKDAAPTPLPSPSAVTTTMELPALSQANPTETPEPLEYVIEDLKGTVLIIESGSTQPEQAEDEQTIEEGDEIITKSGSQASLVLDEDTMFRLSENSDVKVGQLRPQTPQGFISRLQLEAGRILSEVEKLQESHSTFEVSSGGVVCGVRGTAFEVQDQGGVVQTSTFHGVVEMNKGGQVQQVGANQHSTFSLRKGGFLPQRPLRPEERQRYQNWQKRMPYIRKRQAERMEALRAMRALPLDQRRQMEGNLKGVKPRDRMRALHQMYRQDPRFSHPAENQRGPDRLSPGRGAKFHPQKPRPADGRRHNAARPERHPSRSGGHPNRSPYQPRPKTHQPWNKPAAKPNLQKHPAQKPAPAHPGAKMYNKKKSEDKNKKRNKKFPF